MINHCCLFFSAPFLWFKLLKIIYLLQEWIKCTSIFTGICSPCCPYIYLFQWWKSCSSPLGETQIFVRQWQNDITSKGMHWIHWIFCCFFPPSQEAVHELSIQKCLTLQRETVSDTQAREDHLLMQCGVQMLLLFLKLFEWATPIAVYKKQGFSHGVFS